MLIANSVFDAVHRRPVSIYNRATVELLLAILFDQTFIVPTGSVLDSPVLLSVFGNFLKAQESYGVEAVAPIELSVDPKRHFNPSLSKAVIFQAADAFLSGTSETGRDLAAEKLKKYPIPHNFAFISAQEVAGRKRNEILKRLRKNDWTVIENNFSPYFADHAHALNRYFAKNPGRIKPGKNIYETGMYSSYLPDRVAQYANSLKRFELVDLTNGAQHLKSALQTSAVSTRNQLYRFGLELMGGDFDKYYAPMIHYHYWDFASRAMGTRYSANLEIGENVDSAIVSAILEDLPPQNVALSSQIRFVRDNEDTSEDGYAAFGRIQVDWREVLEFRSRDDTREKINAIKNSDGKSELKKNTDAYVRHIADNLSLKFALEPENDGTFTVSLGAHAHDDPPLIKIVKKVVLPLIAAASAPLIHDGGAIGGMIGYMTGLAATELISAGERSRDRRTWRRLTSLETFRLK